MRSRSKILRMADRIIAMVLVVLYFQGAFLILGAAPTKIELDLVSFMALFAVGYVVVGTFEFTLAPWLTDKYFLVMNKVFDKLGLHSS